MMPDRDKILVSHILDAIRAVERFVKGKSKEDVPWGEIIGMRNILIHDYFGTDLESIWDAIGEDFPKLREKLT